MDDASRRRFVEVFREKIDREVSRNTKALDGWKATARESGINEKYAARMRSEFEGEWAERFGMDDVSRQRFADMFGEKIDREMTRNLEPLERWKTIARESGINEMYAAQMKTQFDQEIRCGLRVATAVC